MELYRIVLDKCCTIMMIYLYDLRFQYHLTIQWERFINVYTSKRILCIANHKKYVSLLSNHLYSTEKQANKQRRIAKTAIPGTQPRPRLACIIQP